jgi:excisionase family DNA binding protein
MTRDLAPATATDYTRLSHQEITIQLQAARIRAAEEHVTIARALQRVQQVLLECAELETAAAQLGGNTAAAEAPSSDKQPVADPAWLTAQQAADRAHRSIDTIYRAADSGELHGHQTGRKGRWAFRPAAVDSWNAGDSSFAACGCRKLRLARRGA